MKQVGASVTAGSETAAPLYLPLRLRGGGMMDDSGSGSSSEDNYMSAAEELSLSPTPHKEKN